MDAAVFTTVSTVLLGCKEMFHVQPENVVIYTFAMEGGNIFRYNENGGRSQMKLTMPDALEGGTAKNIRLRAELKDGEVVVGGQIHIDKNILFVYGNEDDLETTNLDSLASNSAYYLANGNVYNIKCRAHMVLSYTVKGSLHGSAKTNTVLPCDGLSFNEDGTAVFLEKDGQCKTALLSSNLKQEDVFECTGHQIFLNPGILISEIYSLRYLVINHKSCFSGSGFLNDEFLDNTHVQFRYAEPSTTTISTKTKYTSNKTLIYGVIGFAVLIVIGLVIAGIAVYSFCGDRSKVKSEVLILPEPKPAVAAEPSIPTPNLPDLPVKKTQEPSFDPLQKKAMIPLLIPDVRNTVQSGQLVADDEDGLAGTKSILAYEPGGPPVAEVQFPARLNITVNKIPFVFEKSGDAIPTFSGHVVPYTLMDKGAKKVVGVKHITNDNMKLFRIELKILRQLNDRFEKKDRLHPTVLYGVVCHFSPIRKGAILITELYEHNLQTEAVNLSFAGTLILGYRCLLCLHQVHSIGFAHLNVTPASFVFNKQDRIVLTEFGIGRRFGRERFVNRGDVMFASIGCHDYTVIAEMDDYQSWLLMVLSFMHELPYFAFDKSNRNFENKRRLWSEIRKAKVELIVNIKDNKTFGEKENIEMLVELSKLSWNTTKEGTMDFNGIVELLQKTVSDNKMNIYKDDWKKEPLKKSLNPTELSDLQSLKRNLR